MIVLEMRKERDTWVIRRDGKRIKQDRRDYMLADRLRPIALAAAGKSGAPVTVRRLDAGGNPIWEKIVTPEDAAAHGRWEAEWRRQALGRPAAAGDAD